MTQGRQDILNGWKEIASYISRDIRTVERWEKQRGLPVRRVPGAGRSAVFAHKAELDEWMASGPSALAQPFLADPAATPQPHLPEDADREDDDDPAVPFVAVPFVTGTSAPVAPAPVAFAPEALSPVGDPAPASPVPDLHALGTGARQPSEQLAAAVPQPALPETAVEPSSPVPPAKLPTRYRGVVPAGLAAAAVCALLLVFILLLRSKVRVEPAAHAGAPTQELPHAAAGVPYRSREQKVDDLYMRGTFFFEQRTPESLESALRYFSNAEHLDPSYAPAFSGEARTWLLLREYSTVPEQEAYRSAKLAAERAIQLDPRLADAHASLGFLDFFWLLDGDVADREFRQAIQINAQSAVAHHWYGSVLLHQRRFTEALHELDLAQHLDPTSSAIVTTRAFALGLSGQRPEALQILEELEGGSLAGTNQSTVHRVIGYLSMLEPRDVDRFLVENIRSSDLRHDGPDQARYTQARRILKSHGERPMWQNMLENERRRQPGAADGRYDVAEYEAMLGDRDRALADLQELTVQHNPALSTVAIDPFLANLHGDPRFDALVGRVLHARGAAEPAARLLETGTDR